MDIKEILNREITFHSDQHLIETMIELLSQVDMFVETGTYKAETLLPVSQAFPKLRCLSCEIDEERFNFSAKKCKKQNNVLIYKKKSQDFLKEISKDGIFNKKVLFWLDAHGYGYEWPLKDEISFITKNFSKFFVFIDDFKVPGKKCFQYDQYKEHVCSFEYIRGSIKGEIDVYYPNYAEHTSKKHPLRGWVMLTKGMDYNGGKFAEKVK